MNNIFRTPPPPGSPAWMRAIHFILTNSTNVNRGRAIHNEMIRNANSGSLSRQEYARLFNTLENRLNRLVNVHNNVQYNVINAPLSNSNSNNGTRRRLNYTNNVMNNVALRRMFNENAANRRRKANTPVNRSWKNNLNNKTDPISLRNKTNWNGNLAIEVNKNGRKNYFDVASFNRWFGNAWKNMPPNSNAPINPTKRHPLNRSIVKRAEVKLVKFTGNKI